MAKFEAERSHVRGVNGSAQTPLPPIGVHFAPVVCLFSFNYLFALLPLSEGGGALSTTCIARSPFWLKNVRLSLFKWYVACSSYYHAILPPVIPRGIRGSVGQAFLPLSVIAWWHQSGIYCPIPLHRPILGSLVIVLSHKMAETSGFDTHWRLGSLSALRSISLHSSDSWEPGDRSFAQNG